MIDRGIEGIDLAIDEREEAEREGDLTRDG